jgi:hypothetical protein
MTSFLGIWDAEDYLGQSNRWLVVLLWTKGVAERAMANQERRRGRWTRGREKALMTAVGMLIVVLSKRRQHAAKHERNEMFQRHETPISVQLFHALMSPIGT